MLHTVPLLLLLLHRQDALARLNLRLQCVEVRWLRCGVSVDNGPLILLRLPNDAALDPRYGVLLYGYMAGGVSSEFEHNFSLLNMLLSRFNNE